VRARPRSAARARTARCGTAAPPPPAGAPSGSELTKTHWPGPGTVKKPRHGPLTTRPLAPRSNASSATSCAAGTAGDEHGYAARPRSMPISTCSPRPPTWPAWPCSGCARHRAGGRWPDREWGWPDREQPALHARQALSGGIASVPRASTAAPGLQNDRPETSLYGQGMAFSSADPLKRTPFDTSLLGGWFAPADSAEECLNRFGLPVVLV